MRSGSISAKAGDYKVREPAYQHIQSQQTGISDVLDTVKALPSFPLSPHFHHCIKKYKTLEDGVQ